MCVYTMLVFLFFNRWYSGSVQWHGDIICLYSPTPEQCEEVTSQLKTEQQAGKEWNIFLFVVSPESATCHNGHS